MDHWPQRDGVIINSTDDQLASGFADHHQQQQPKKPRPQKEQSLNCPRCTSTNTKFCYYNNYSLSQPRYFCKTCKRYWTEGGTLRNVPVGGGSRRNKRPSSSSSSSSSSKKTITHAADHAPHLLLNHNQWQQDLTLNPNPNPNPNHPSLIPVPMPIQPMSAGFTMPTSQDQFVKQGLNFSLNYGYQNGYGSLQLGFQENSYNNEGARVFFPFEDQSKNVHQSDDQFEGTGGYWSGLQAGGGSW